MMRLNDLRLWNRYRWTRNLLVGTGVGIAPLVDRFYTHDLLAISHDLSQMTEVLTVNGELKVSFLHDCPKKECNVFSVHDSPDPLTMERGKCLERNGKVQKMAGVLQACEQRVASKSYTAETCSQEVIDLMEELDHCVGKKAFAKMT